jgi:hypothetical protein
MRKWSPGLGGRPSTATTGLATHVAWQVSFTYEQRDNLAAVVNELNRMCPAVGQGHIRKLTVASTMGPVKSGPNSSTRSSRRIPKSEQDAPAACSPLPATRLPSVIQRRWPDR